MAYILYSPSLPIEMLLSKAQLKYNFPIDALSDSFSLRGLFFFILKNENL